MGHQGICAPPERIGGRLAPLFELVGLRKRLVSFCRVGRRQLLLARASVHPG